MVSELIHADAIEGMKKLPSNSYDCILIDPPYNIGVDFGNSLYKKKIEDYA